MKLPPEYAEITIYDDHEWDYPYPPSSFLPFWEHELGNGDMYGLYWPVGKESEEPIVAEMWHDSGEMAPQFSTLGRFLECSNKLEDEFGRPEPTVENDNRSPMALMARAKEELSGNNVEGCVTYLETALEVLPEYTGALGLLAMQYRRLRERDNALRYALKALRCPPSFGHLNDQLCQWFSRQKEAPEDVARDPLWGMRGQLTWKYGGAKQNDNYLILKEVLEEYLQSGMVIEWFHMSQTYSEIMCSKTTSFHERYGFDPSAWYRGQIDQWTKLSGVSRHAPEAIQ